MSNSRLEALIREVQKELTKQERNKIITVITIDVHNRDLVQTLIDKKVRRDICTYVVRYVCMDGYICSMLSINRVQSWLFIAISKLR